MLNTKFPYYSKKKSVEVKDKNEATILTENTGICIKPEYVIKFLKSKFKLKNW